MNIIKAVLVISILAFSNCSFAQQKDKEVMIKNIFSVLKNKDEAGFVKLFPDAETMRIFITATMFKDSSVAGAEMKEAMNGFLENLSDENLKNEYGEEYSTVISNGEKKGVVWANANFVSYTADSAIESEDGIEMVKLAGKIYFTVASKEYFIVYKDIIWFADKGWYGVSIERIDEKSRENEEEEIMELKEVMVDTTSSFLPNDSFATDKVADVELKKEQPIPVKKATPAKPASKSSKSKSATPAARKPD